MEKNQEKYHTFSKTLFWKQRFKIINSKYSLFWTILQYFENMIEKQLETSLILDFLKNASV